MKRCLGVCWMMVLSVSVVHAAPVAAEADTWDAKKDRIIRSTQIWGQKIARSASHAWKIVRSKSDAVTKKLVGGMNKPLDRSAADKKAAMLNNSLEEANRAAAAATEKAKQANREIYKLKHEGFGSSGAAAKKGGRFTSLD